MLVYHFLPKDWALDDISKKRLKISLIEDLNDPFELLSIDVSNPIVRQALCNTRRELSERNGVLCFSRSWSNPVLWSHYADKRKGIALGFEIPHTTDLSLFMEVSYVNGRVTQSVQDLERWDEKAMERLLSTKFEHWKYEDEVRIFVHIDERDADGRFYVPFSDKCVLREIVLGVRCEPVERHIHELVHGFAQPVKVTRARLDFGSFSVVE